MGIAKVIQWALETLYPGGGQPWNGQPCKVAPIGDVFTGDTPASPENMNYVLNGLSAGAQAGLDCAVAVAVQNAPVQTNATIFGVAAGSAVSFEWDSYFQRWVGDQGGGGSGHVPVSYDGGLTWQDFGSVKKVSGTGPLAVSPVDGSVISVNFGGGGTGSVRYWPGSTGVGVENNVTALNPCGVAPTFQGAAKYFSPATGKWQVFGVGGTSKSTWVTSPDGTTWTDKSTSQPASFTGNATTILAMAAAASPALLVVAQCGQTAGTDTALVMSTADGSTSTDVTPSALSGKVITGLHYSDADALFGLLAYDGVHSYLYTSPAPASGSWTLVKTFSSLHMVGLTSLGQVWIVTGSLTLASNNVQALGASSTWSRLMMAPVSNGVNFTTPQTLRTTGSQVLIWNDSFRRFSLVAGLNTPSAAY